MQVQLGIMRVVSKLTIFHPVFVAWIAGGKESRGFGSYAALEIGCPGEIPARFRGWAQVFVWDLMCYH